jgi:hypothetical protein
MKWLLNLFRKPRERMYRIETEFLVFECPESVLPYWYAVHGNSAKVTELRDNP